MQIDAPACGTRGEVRVAARVRIGLLPWQPDGKRRRIQQSLSIRQGVDVGPHTRIDPLPGEHIARVRGETRAQLESRGRCALAKRIQVRPRPLGIDVIRCHRAYAAPVIDTRTQQERKVIGEIGRGLQAHAGAEQDARGGESREVGLLIEVGLTTHGRVVLGAEILNDHFLHVPMAPVDRTDGEERIDALLIRLADADEDAGREGNRQATRVLEDLQADARLLVGAAEVGSAGGGPQTLGGGLEHHPHAGRDGSESTHLLPRHHARIEVRQQPGLLEDPDRHRAHVGERVGVPRLVEPLASRGPAILGPIAEGEESLSASEGNSAAGDVEDLIGREIRRGHAVRDSRESAVVAAVPAQAGERDEDLGRVGDDSGQPGVLEPAIAQRSGDVEQLLEGIPTGADQPGGLVGREGRSPPGAGQRPDDPRRRGRHRDTL